ncbi:MAG: hypothetical protein R6U50_09815 [Desulfobacterales bacterium]
MTIVNSKRFCFGDWSNGKALAATVFFVCFCLLFPQAGFAAWSSDPIPVTTEFDKQCRPQVVYDGSGGYYVVWQDFDVDVVFAQHYTPAGDPMWNDPVQVGSGTCYHMQESAPDGSGGLLVSFYDCSYTRVQRVNADGSLAWNAGGVAVIDDSDSWIAPDGAGGAIVMSYYGYVNKVAADGTLPWTDADNPLVFSSSSSATKIAPDGEGGAILVWLESSNVMANRIDSEGNFYGEPLDLSSGSGPYCPRLIPDYNGGAIVAWMESGDTDYVVRAQKIDGDSGQVLWGEGGGLVALSPDPWPVDLAPDGSGGAFINWGDWDNDVVYAQYMDVNGDPVWANPVALSSAGDLDEIAWHPHNTVADGQGGFITAWGNPSQQIKAQRVDAAGSLLWGVDGAVLADGNYIDYPPKVTSNGQGGAVAVWVDDTSYSSEPRTLLVIEGTGDDIFMQGVNADGVAGDPGYSPEDDSDSNTNWPHCFISSLFGN